MKLQLFRFAMALIAFLALGFAGCNKNTESGPAEPPSLSEVRYTCPMHPHIVQDQKGTCPICHMDLVAIKEQEPKTVEHNAEDSTQRPEGRETISVSGAKQQLIGVKTESVVRKVLYKKISAPGQVAFDPQLYTAISEYQEGLKQRQRVRKSPLDSVKKNVERMVESARIRLRVLGLSDCEIKAIRPSQGSESLLIGSKNGGGWIYAEVFESELFAIKPGQEAEIKASFLQGKTLIGKVASTDEMIDSQTRTGKVRIQVEAGSVTLRPQSFVNVTILAPQGEHLAVPEDAIIDTGKEQFVFIQNTPGSFEPRLIQTLFRADEWVAVADGVSAGEKIVVSANFLLDSESRLKAVFRQMTTKDTQ